MTIDERLVDAANALRHSTREVTSAVRSTHRKKAGTKGPVLALATALLVLAIAAMPGLLLGADSSLAPIGSGAYQGGDLVVAGSSIALGSDGPHFGIDDPSWVLVDAWRPADDSRGSFIVYENGGAQLSTMTGSVAEEALQEIGESRGEAISEPGTAVTEYVWSGGVSYVWATSDGRAVVITFGQMSPDEAKTTADLLEAIDQAAFAALLVSHPATPTTLAHSP